MNCAKVHLYVDSGHSIGGVTTWAFQVAPSLGEKYAGSVITVTHGNSAPQDLHLFPGPQLPVSGMADRPQATPEFGTSHVLQNDRPQRVSCKTREGRMREIAQLHTEPTVPTRATSPSSPTEPTLPTISTVPTKPTRPTTPTTPSSMTTGTRATRPTLPTKPTIPTKATLPSRASLLGGGSALKCWDDLDEVAQAQVAGARIFFPNYVEVGYRHAALSRLQNFPSRCIGVCHTDQEFYYALLAHYEAITQTFIAVSRRCALRLRRLLPHRSNDIHELPYGVAVDELRTVIGKGPIRLLYAGRIVKAQKRIMDFVELIRLLDERACNYVFDFVGVGRDREELLEAVSGAPTVRVLPGVTQQDMASVYTRYDVLLLASETEGMSIAMLEAMARGVVPVVTRVSGAEDVIQDGQNGFLCGVGNMQEMAQHILSLSSERSLLAEMSARAASTIRASYSLETYTKEFNALVDLTAEKPLMSPAAAKMCLAAPPTIPPLDASQQAQ